MKLRLFIIVGAVAIATQASCMRERAETPQQEQVPPSASASEASDDAPVTTAGSVAGTTSPVASSSPAPEEVAPPEPLSNEPPPPVEFETPHRFGARPVVTMPIQASAQDTVLGTWNVGGVADPDFITNRRSFHAATRVILDTRLLSGKKSLGRLSAKGILAQTRNQGYWPFRLCFEDARRAGTDERTTAVLRFSIDTRGKVSYARLMRADSSAALAKCLRKAAYAPRFSPAPPRRVDVELTAQIAKGDVPLPPRDPVGSAPLGNSPPGNATVVADSTVESFSALTPKVAECYRSGLGTDAGLWGRAALVVRCEEGQPRRVEQHLSQFPNEAVTSCITELALAAADTDACDLVVAWRLGVPKVVSEQDSAAAP